MNKLLRALPSLLVALLLVGILAALVYMNRSVDASDRVQANDLVRELKQLDALWGLDVLRSKNELNKNYDPISDPLARLREVQATLDVLADKAGRASMEKSLKALQESLAEKSDLVDAFKAQNSVLKNSLRYLPTAEQELRSLIAEAHASGAHASAELDALGQVANDLLVLVLRYNNSADADLKGLIEDKLNRLRAMQPTLAPPFADQSALLITHAQAVLTQKTSEDQVLGQIAASPSGERINALGRAFDESFNARLKQSNQWRIALIAYAAFLLLFLMYLGVRLFRSYRLLHRAKRSLEQANETLEARVMQRTHDLSSAMRRLEESHIQLVQAEKMASLGQMVAGVAHEINTPLAYVKNSLEVVASRIPDVQSLVQSSSELTQQMARNDASQEDLARSFGQLQEIASAFEETQAVDELHGLIQDGMHGIDHISEIVLNLKNFSRLDRAKMDHFNVNEGLESTLKIAQGTIKRRVVHKRFEPVPAIECAPSQINQVFLNLINNACHATAEDGGEITIATHVLPQAAGVKIEIADNGRGIPLEFHQKVFDPFFTTKPTGEGTGLGLSIVQRIVKEHGGSIHLASRVGVGTLFGITLPLRQQQPQPAGDDLPALPPAAAAAAPPPPPQEQP